MKKTCSKILHSKSGFTLIELLVVTSIITLLFTVGIAAYQNFNRGQIVVQAAKELKENLRLAQSKASSGEKPNGCTGTLNGWQISIPNNSNSYELQAVCSNGTFTSRTILLAGDLEKIAGPSYVLFKVLAQGVEFPGEERTITITGFGDKIAKVTVTPTGEIKIGE